MIPERSTEAAPQSKQQSAMRAALYALRNFADKNYTTMGDVSEAEAAIRGLEDALKRDFQ